MSTQIFKNNIPNELLFNLLNKICMKNEKHFVLNNIAFKKGVYDNSINYFLEKFNYFYISTPL